VDRFLGEVREEGCDPPRSDELLAPLLAQQSDMSCEGLKSSLREAINTSRWPRRTKTEVGCTSPSVGQCFRGRRPPNWRG